MLNGLKKLLIALGTPAWRFLRRPNAARSLIIVVLVFVSVWALVDKEITLGDWKRGSSDTVLGLRLGLDLKGGTRLLYEAEPPPGSSSVSDADMEGVIDSIERRVNAFGVAEPIIQRIGGNKVQVQLPGIKDVEEAKRLIGRPANLEFHELNPEGTFAPALARDSQGNEIPLTGRFLKRNSTVVADPQTGLPQVAFEFTNEGGDMFRQITRRNRGRPLGIVVDGEVISAPTVQAEIGTNGVITGLSLDDAQILSIQLNSGALPLLLNLVRESTVDATLGQDSVDKSLLAGAIGLAMVLGFMIAIYRIPGFLAGAALVVYTLIVLAIFKTIPVTLTLAGVAGFILSIGMAVDANILIFERTKEERRAGKSLVAAIEAGFDRAWPSIRDSNISTFITCAILFWFGDRLGESVITGFAVTLFIGVAVSMFSAIFVTRTFMRLLSRSRLRNYVALFRT